MAWDIASGAGVTALGLAAARSVESGRGDRLIEDPYARALFEGAGVELPMRLDWPGPDESVSATEALHLHGSRYIGLRTRFYDDLLQSAVEQGIGQAVVLGAGLDTRAFRLVLDPGLHVIELDQDPVLAYKARTLAGLGVQPRCRRSAVGIDLREDWPAALQATSFDPDRPTAWIAEGLLPYLPAPAQAQLVQSIASLSAPGSVLALDRITGDPATGERLRDLTDRSGLDMENLFAGGDSSGLAAALRGQGWEVGEEQAATLAPRYGRDLSDPFGDGSAPAEPPWLDTVFVSARRHG